MPTSGSRAEFLAVDELGATNDIKYGRTGGWFVSTKKAMFLGLLVILAMALVGILVHYMATCKGVKLGKDNGTEIEALVDIPHDTSTTSESTGIPAAELLLPRDITPLYYRLRLDPYLDDPAPDGSNFTYKGHVSIRIHCHNATNSVSFHAKDLEIGQDINVTLSNETSTKTTATSSLTSSASTSAPTPTAGYSNTTSDEAKTTSGTTNATTMTARTTTISATVGPRNKRDVSFRKHHRRRQVTSTTTTPVPQTTLPPGTSPRVTGRVPEQRKEMYTISLEPALEAGQTYILDISFTGLLKDSLYGFYRSSYKDENGTKIWMAATQFEPTHAREAFPCFDEPAMKSRFEISIARPTGMVTLSNMPIRASEAIAGRRGRVWDHYEVSPRMSTYLVAFVLANPDFIPTKDTGYLDTNSQNVTSTEFRVYARKRLIDSAEYAMSIGPRILKFYGEFFSIHYPLPKMDLAAIPDFGAGAMENWGLVTYRETNLLYDPASSPMSDKDKVVIIVAHELAHQWFGNLVTMKWWSDLWLNEGFATYMQYVGSNHVEPSWAMQDKFLVYEQQPAMALDSLRSTHPVSSKVDNPSQISEVFDSISYSKGASLIRMLNNSLTEDVLRKGLTRYLNKWTYGNAEEGDLWEALTEEMRHTPTSSLPPNVTVKQVMDTWTLQEGYPVLTVTRDYSAGSAVLSQVRFTLDNSSTDTLWYIPVSYVTQEEMNDAANSDNRTLPRIWLKKESTITVANLTKPKSNKHWALFNVDATGYYRVNYDTRNWRLLASHLLNSSQQDMLSAITRAQLLDDALNLARAGALGYDVALNMTRYLAARESHYVPWRAMFENMRFLDFMLRQTPTYGLFQNYLLKTLATMKSNMGFEPTTNETQPQTLLRPNVLAWLSKMGDPSVVTWAKMLFQQWTNSSSPDTENPISVDVRRVVYCTAVRSGGRFEWDFILQRYLAAVDKPSEAEVLLASLVCTHQEWLLITLLEKSLEASGDIRLQDAIIVWDEIPFNVVGSRVAFNYIRDKWGSIYDRFGKDEYLMGDILHGSISGLTTERDNKDVKEFYETNKGKFSFAERKMEQEMEGLKLRVDWHTSNYNTVASWLQEYQDE